MNTEQERAEFEAWANGRCELHLVNPAGRYSSAITLFAWEAYQAGRAALAAQAQEAAPAAPQPAPPAQQPLTDEQKAILKECRDQAMRWTLKARIPELGAFGGIAQDLDYLCGQLGIKND